MSAIQQVLAASAPSDTTPNPFSFTDQSNVALSTIITSNTITITGINTATNVSMSGGTSMAYSIAGGSFISSGGTITNGQTLQVRQLSSSSYSTAAGSVVTVGGTSTVWTVTTQAAPPPPIVFTPDPFFTNIMGGATAGTYYSSTVTISNLTPSTNYVFNSYAYLNGSPWPSSVAIDASPTLPLSGAYTGGAFVVTSNSSGIIYANVRALFPGNSGAQMTNFITLAGTDFTWFIYN